MTVQMRRDRLAPIGASGGAHTHQAGDADHRQFTLPVVTTLEWARDGNCAGLPAETADALFFPGHANYSDVAKEMCASCPVASDCLNHAVTNYELGFWAGTGEAERKQIRGDMRRWASGPLGGNGFGRGGLKVRRGPVERDEQTA